MNKISLLLIMLLLTACSIPHSTPDAPSSHTPVTQAFPTVSPTPDPPGSDVNNESGMPILPQPGDAGLSRGNVYLESTDLLILESYPIQVNLYLSGTLPTPCNQLRVQVNEPDAETRIYIEVYSVSDPNAMCVQVLEPFDTTISLGSFSAGHYTVFVNGEMIGEFDS